LEFKLWLNVSLLGTLEKMTERVLKRLKPVGWGLKIQVLSQSNKNLVLIAPLAIFNYVMTYLLQVYANFSGVFKDGAKFV
jgi:hypothetical protein